MSVKILSERKRMTKDERAARLKTAGEKMTSLTIVLPLVKSNPLTNASDEDLERKSTQHQAKLKSDDSVKESTDGKLKLKDIFMNMKKVFKTLNEKKKKTNPIQTLLFPCHDVEDEQSMTPHAKRKESTRIRSRKKGAAHRKALEAKVKAQEKKMDNNSIVHESSKARREETKAAQNKYKVAGSPDKRRNRLAGNKKIASSNAGPETKELLDKRRTKRRKAQKALAKGGKKSLDSKTRGTAPNLRNEPGEGKSSPAAKRDKIVQGRKAWWGSSGGKYSSGKSRAKEHFKNMSGGKEADSADLFFDKIHNIHPDDKKAMKMDNNSTNVVNLKSMVLEKSVEKCSKYKARKSAYDHPNDKGKVNMYLEPLKAASKGADNSYDHPHDRGKMLLGMPKKGKGKKKVKKAKKKAK